MFKITKGSETESRTFRLPVELIVKLNDLATENKVSVSNLVIQCLIYAVDNLNIDDENNE